MVTPNTIINAQINFFFFFFYKTIKIRKAVLKIEQLNINYIVIKSRWRSYDGIKLVKVIYLKITACVETPMY